MAVGEALTYGLGTNPSLAGYKVFGQLDVGTKLPAKGRPFTMRYAAMRDLMIQLGSRLMAEKTVSPWQLELERKL